MPPNASWLQGEFGLEFVKTTPTPQKNQHIKKLCSPLEMELIVENLDLSLPLHLYVLVGNFGFELVVTLPEKELLMENFHFGFELVNFFGATLGIPNS